MNGDNNELISNDKIRLKMYNSNIKNNQINNNKEIVKYSQINNTYDLDSKNNDASYQDNLMVNNGFIITNFIMGKARNFLVCCFAISFKFR